MHVQRLFCECIYIKLHTTIQAFGVNKQTQWFAVLMAKGDEMAVTFKGGICEPQI